MFFGKFNTVSIKLKTDKVISDRNIDGRGVKKIRYDDDGLLITGRVIGRNGWSTVFIPWSDLEDLSYVRGDTFMEELNSFWLSKKGEQSRASTQAQNLRDQELARTRKAEKDRLDAEAARRKLVDEQNRKIREAEQAKTAQENERKRKAQLLLDQENERKRHATQEKIDRLRGLQARGHQVSQETAQEERKRHAKQEEFDRARSYQSARGPSVS